LPLSEERAPCVVLPQVSFERGLLGAPIAGKPVIAEYLFKALQPSLIGVSILLSIRPQAKPESAVQESGSEQGKILVVIGRIFAIQTGR